MPDRRRRGGVQSAVSRRAILSPHGSAGIRLHEHRARRRPGRLRRRRHARVLSRRATGGSILRAPTAHRLSAMHERGRPLLHDDPGFQRQLVALRLLGSDHHSPVLGRADSSDPRVWWARRAGPCLRSSRRRSRPLRCSPRGWLLDRSPGIPGHQHFFVFLSAFAATGLIASLRFRT